MAKYGVKTAKGNILCTDGEYRAVIFVGAGTHSPKFWKTRKGAQKFASRIKGKVFEVK